MPSIPEMPHNPGPGPERTPRDQAEIIIRRGGFTIVPHAVQELGNQIANRVRAEESSQNIELALLRPVKIVFLSGSNEVYGNRLHEALTIFLSKSNSGQVSITGLKDIEGKDIIFPFEETNLIFPPAPKPEDFEELVLMPPVEINKPAVQVFQAAPENKSLYPLDPKSNDFRSELSLRSLITDEIRSTKDPVLKEVLGRIRKKSIEDSSNPKNPNSCFEMKSFSEVMSDASPETKAGREALRDLCGKWTDHAFGGNFISRALHADYYSNVAQVYGYVSSLLYLK